MSQQKRSRDRAGDHSAPQDQQKKRFPWWTVVVIALCICLLAGAYVFAEGQLADYNRFHAMRSAVAGNTFYGAIFIDDVPLEGKTVEQARSDLSMARDAKGDTFQIYLEHENMRYPISSSDVPMEWNTEDLLEQAYTIGRKGTLEERYASVKTLTEPVYLTSEFTYDRDTIRQITDRAAQELYQPMTDATVVAFDKDNRTFTFTDEVRGQQANAEKLYRDTIQVLDSRSYDTPIQIEVTPLEPTITKAQLQQNYVKIATYTSKTTKDENRNTNIRLSAEALHGAVIMPGGTISFNEKTGERTPEKGYKEAGAIANGRMIEETGGGVCQVSSTLFNALVRAEAEIVDRKPHAWPLDYVPRGEDATVDWPRLDLVMKNPGTTPMYLAAWYENQTVTVEVYGYSLGNNVRIDLESEVTYQKEPTERVYTYNANLPVGTEKLLKKPRTGYSVQTYKVYYEGDQQVRREPFYKSEYRMINEEYEYNDGKPPAPTP